METATPFASAWHGTALERGVGKSSARLSRTHGYRNCGMLPPWGTTDMAGIREWIQRRCKGSPSQHDVDEILQDLAAASNFVEWMIAITKKLQAGTEKDRLGDIIKNGDAASDEIGKVRDALKRLGGR